MVAKYSGQVLVLVLVLCCVVAVMKQPSTIASVEGWVAATTSLPGDVGQKVQILKHPGSEPISFNEFIDLMEHNAAFAAYFSSVLAATPWDGFFWECPPISNALLQRPFESVLLPGTFADADPSSFEQHLSKCERSTGATHFLSLGGDAVLVAPCERGPRTRYGHLCAFVRHAEAAQQQAFWREVATTLRATLLERGKHSLTWLNTEGSGVPWLHVRLDSRPKYYHHRAYKTRPE